MTTLRFAAKKDGLGSAKVIGEDIEEGIKKKVIIKNLLFIRINFYCRILQLIYCFKLNR